MTRNLGFINLSHALINQWLDLRGAKILSAQYNHARDCVDLVIEHRDMPAVEIGAGIPEVLITMQRGADGSVHRIDPPKHSTEWEN